MTHHHAHLSPAERRRQFRAQQAERVRQAIADGCDLVAAAARVGMAFETVRCWLDDDADFRARCRAAAEIGCPPLAKRLAREDAVRAAAAAEEAQREEARRARAENAARVARMDEVRARERAAWQEQQEHYRRINLGLAPADEPRANEMANGADGMKAPTPTADGNTANLPPGAPPQPPEKEKKHPYLVPAGWSIVLPDEPPVHLTMADYDPFSWRGWE